MKKWPQIRDIGLFVGGIAGVVHETLFTHSDRPELLILFAAMMGLPAFLQPRENETTVIVRENEKPTPLPEPEPEEAK